MAPVLAAKCQSCHGPEKAKGKYRLDTFERLMKPGSSGELPVTAGKPGQSELYKRLIAPDPDDRMPQKADPLPAAQVETIKRWIEQGATFDGPDPAASIGSLSAESPRESAPQAYPVPIAVTALAFAADPKVLDRIADVMTVVRFSPNGSRLAIGGADNAIRIYDVATGKRELLIEQHADWVTDLAFSPDGGKLVSASRDKSCRVFDAKTGATESAFVDSDESVYAVAWADDGKRVFSTGRDRKIRAWNPADGKKAGDAIDTEGDIFHLAAASGLLFACSSDGTVRAYSQDKLKAVREFGRFGDWAYALALSPDGHALAAGGHDGSVRVWDTGDGKERVHFVAAPGFASHDAN